MKKIRSSICVIFLILLFLAVTIFAQIKIEQKKFHDLSQDILQSSYGEDALSRHFSFEHAQEFGILAKKQLLPCYKKSVYKDQNEETNKYIKELEAIDQKKLSKKAKETYQILKYDLIQKRKNGSFLYFEEPFSPTSGIQASLPVLLSEYKMKNRNDVESYLSLLSYLPTYFDSLLSYEKDKAFEGKFMASEDVDMVISQCSFMASEKGKELFSSCFKDCINHVSILSQKDKDSYLSLHTNIIDTTVSPAYTKVAKELLLLKEAGKEQKGLCQYPNGKQYYEMRIKRLIGTGKSISEIESLLQNRMKVLAKEFEAEKEEYKKKNPKCDIEKIETIENAVRKQFQDEEMTDFLCDIQKCMCKEFPRLTEQGHVTIKPIPDTLIPYTAPAYYFVPQIEKCSKKKIDKIENIIYINPEANNDPVNLFTTLAHEGYPGHMYQNMYFMNSQGVSKDNVLRYCMDFPGYSEGWAMYVELMSYDYVAKCFHDIDAKYVHLLKLSREMQLCLLCYLDIQLHDHGASIAEIAKCLSQIGITQADSIHDVYSYLVNEPGTYLKYYVGYLELLECKEIYLQTFCNENERESELAFHTFFLSHGPDSYENIRNAIIHYNQSFSSSIMLSKYPLSQRSIFNFLAASTAGEVKY